MPTGNDYRSFGEKSLDEAISFIAKNLEPSDVFDKDVLEAFARDKYEPDDIFTETTLAQWAVDNGYVKDAAEDA